MQTSDDFIVWIDCEMTGLDQTKDKIIEIACIITDASLTIVDELDSIIIHQSNELLDSMDEWNTTHHGQSGLTERVQKSTTTTQQAQDQVLTFVKKYVKSPRTAPLAGNSIYVDRQYISREMPALDAFLHYRIIDVSCFKEIGKRWYPKEFTNAPKKSGKHRALDDIRESIEELKYYRQAIFKE
jgi:oligoribonuclease